MSEPTQHWLARLCDPRRQVGNGVCRRPYLIDLPAYLGVRPWAVATDGKIAAFLLDWHMPDSRFAPLEVTPPDGEHREKIHANLARLFAPPGVAAWEGDVAGLAAWLGPPEWLVPCPACKGTSAVSEHVSCSFCEDDGDVVPEPRLGHLCGVPINRELLARAVAHVSGRAAVHVGPVPDVAGADAAWVKGDGWRVLVMRMQPGIYDREAWAEAPRFPPVKPS